jgi:hypothetical protein
MASFSDEFLRDKEAREAYRQKLEFEDYKWVMVRVKEGYGVPSEWNDPGKLFQINSDKYSILGI